MTTSPYVDIPLALNGLEPVSLTQLDQAQLHDRVESKVLLRHADVGAAIETLKDDYLVLNHEGDQSQWYRTEYFDDEMLRCYHQHHNQKRTRYKARYRTYLNSDITYFEVKQNISGRTVKTRRRSVPPKNTLWPEDALFFFETTGLPPETLRPSLRVEYERILLVRNDFSERVTMDLNIQYFSETQMARHVGLAVCEFKQGALDRNSPAIVALSRRTQQFSKYCMGLTSCHDQLRRNRFKKVYKRLEALDVSVEQANLVNPPQLANKQPELITL